MHSLRSRAISGAIYLGLGQVLRVVLHLASIVLLARLLTPADFGVFAMAAPVLILGSLFGEAGLGAAIIQRRSIKTTELNAIFWINAILGITVALLLVAVAPAIAAFYREERVEPMIAASGIIVVLIALSAAHLALLNRKMHYGTIALIDSLSLLIGTLLAIGAAGYWHTYWALWLLPLGTHLCTLILSFGFSQWRPGRWASLSEVRDMLRFGRNVVASRLADYLSRNIDKVLIGRAWGSVELGLYDRAYRIVLLPLLFVNLPLERLMLPMLSGTRDDPEKYRKIYSAGLQFALLAIMPPIMVIIVAPEPIVVVILGPDWIPSAPMFRWLAVACLLQLASHPLSSLLMSQARTREMAIANAISSVYSCLAFVAGLPWGATGVAAAYALSELLRTPVLFWWVSRRGPVGGLDQLRIVLPFAIGAALCAPVILALQSLLVTQPLVFTGTAALAAYGATLFGLVLTASGRECLREGRQIARTALSSMKRGSGASAGPLATLE